MISLGSASSFSLLAGSYLTLNASSQVTGDIGAVGAITGATSSTVRGEVHSDGDSLDSQGQNDLRAAYDDAARRLASTQNVGVELGDRTFTAGVYHSGGALNLAADKTVTLDGGNDANAVFIFQTGTYLTTGASGRISLVNGAQASHVFWQIGGYASLGASSQLAGTIMANTYISFGAGVQLAGRGFSPGGYVTLDTTRITNPNATTTSPGTGPAAPGSVSATGGDASALVVWSAANSNGGQPVTGYTITPSPACPNCGGLTTSGLSSTVTGLSNGTAYTFSVTATSPSGTSAPSSSGAVTPDPVAGAPTTVTASGGNTTALVSWKPPVTAGGPVVTGYTVTPSPACGDCGGLTAAGTSTSSTVTGLKNSQPYTFIVAATYATGAPAPSAPSNAITPVAGPAVPGAPGAVTATGGNGSVDLSWAPPVPTVISAPTVMGYTVTPTPECTGCKGLTATGTTTTVAGLTNGVVYTFVVAANYATGLPAPSSPSNTVTPSLTMASGSGFTGTSPTRVMDTRVGTGVTEAKLGAGQALSTSIPGLPAGTTAVALNITVTNPTDVSYLTVYPTGGSRPVASNLNYGPGQTVANMVVVPVGPNNTVSFYNNAGSVDVIADLQGYFAPKAGAGFTGTNPSRALDTRAGTGAPQAKVGPGQTVSLIVPNLPTGATAVSLNVTATNSDSASFLTVFPAGGSRPLASNLNFGPGQTVPNMVLVPLGPGNTITLYNNQGSVDIIADVLGYFSPNAGTGFTGIAPSRALDTRSGVGAPVAEVGAGQTLNLVIPNLPVGTTAVALNVTVTNPDTGSFLTVFPAGGPRPLASNLNYSPGQTVPNLLLVPVGPGNMVSLYNNMGTVDVVADLLGSFK